MITELEIKVCQIPTLSNKQTKMTLCFSYTNLLPDSAASAGLFSSAVDL